MKKILIVFIFIVSTIFGATFVFGNFINFDKNISFIDSNTKNIYTDSKKLNTTLLVFKSNIDISNYSLKTSCYNSFTYIWSKKDLYFFNFKLKDNNCFNPNFILKNEKEIFSETSFKLNIKRKSDIFSLLIDYNNEDLNKLKIKIDNKIKKYLIYRSVLNNNDNFWLLKKQRLLKELEYKQKILVSILNRREFKYNSPVKWYKIPTNLNIIPNSWRPYRSHYTDWIHHWWDIMAPKWTSVQAIDDWVIVRVVRDFIFEDLKKIKKWKDITKLDKLRNLDILRWNQIWLKTAKWDVMFYSHLDEVYDNIKEWKKIYIWQDLWTIWITWVPDKSYTNYHLHFPIHKNPYNIKKAWKYSWQDYMNWEWYLQWLSADEVIRQQRNIFVKEALEKIK